MIRSRESVPASEEVVYLWNSEDRTGAEAWVERRRQDYLELLERVKLGPSRIAAWHVDRQKAQRSEWHGAPKYRYGLGGILIPEEAAIIRESADRFLAGQPVRQITMWLNRDGGPVSPAKGKSRLNIWHASTVKSILGPGNWEGVC